MPPEEPPCETCKEVPFEENKDAIEIFFLVQDQFIMGMNSPIGVKQGPIHEAMRLYKIKNRRECFEKVMFLLKPPDWTGLKSLWWIKGESHGEWGES